MLAVIDDIRIRNGISCSSKLGETLQEVWERRDGEDCVIWTDVFEGRQCTMLIN